MFMCLWWVQNAVNYVFFFLLKWCPCISNHDLTVFNKSSALTVFNKTHQNTYTKAFKQQLLLEMIVMEKNKITHCISLSDAGGEIKQIISLITIRTNGAIKTYQTGVCVCVCV